MPPTTSTYEQRRALGFCVLVGVAALLWLARSVGTGLLLGGLVAFSLQPIYAKLRHRWGGVAAAMICTAGSTTALTLMLVGVGYVLIARGITAISAAPELLAPGAPVRLQLERISERLNNMHVHEGNVIEQLQNEAMELGTQAASLAADALGMVFYAFLTLFFMAITTYFVLRSWERIALAAEVVLPLHPRHTRSVFAQLRDVGRHVFLGTLSTAIAQGVLAGLGFWMCGVPQPAFYGVLAAVSSLVPAVGTLIVWVPLGIYLILTGHTAAGVCEMVYSGLVVVGFSDYFLRPYLVGDTETVPTLLTFVALFGGIEVFGLFGLVLGPILVTLTVALLRTYHDEMSEIHELYECTTAPSSDARARAVDP